MPDDPKPEDDAADEMSDADLAMIERLAAIDDRLSGHGVGTAAAASHESHSPSSAEGSLEDGCDYPSLAPAIDTILLLRQMAATERDSGHEPIVVPRHIGRYEIVREAGRGAFAYVLEAKDAFLRRRVALKVARPEALVSLPFRRRFIREAELAARLVHPNIVAIHEVAEEGGLVFIASEYCAGGDLAEWLERHPGPMPPRQAAELVRGLAGAAGCAHASGVVHRDIKPANVLLAPPPAIGDASRDGDVPITEMTAKLGDFGLGKLFQDRQQEGFTQLTRTGTRLGTPAWMAPEQIDHSFGEVGPATDVHALGLLLDRLLTGRCLFAGKTEVEIFRAVLLEEPTSADRVNRLVPRELAAISLKCLAKRPTDRYASASDLAEDLSRYLDHRQTVARPLSTPTRLARSLARSPVLTVMAALAACGLLVAAWFASERVRAARDHARSHAEKVRLEAAAELRRGFEAWRTGNAAAALDHLRTCSTMDVATGINVSTQDDHVAASLADSLGGRWLFARLHGERAMLLTPDDRNAAHPDLYAFACSHDGHTLAAGGADGRLFILPLASDGGAAGAPRAIMAHDEVNDVAISPDGRQVASAGEDGRLRLWNVEDGSLLRDVFEGSAPLFAAAFSPDGRQIASGGAHRRLRLNPTSEDEEPREWQPFEEAVTEGSVAADSDIESIQFIGDDRLAIACGRLVAILDLSSGGSRLFEGHAGTVGQIAVSRDGTRLLSAGTDREPRVWDLASGQLLLTLPRHPSWVQGCDFSPDGHAIATGCRDGVVRIFDAATGRQQRQIVGHIGRTWDVKYGSDGMVLSSGADGTLRRWGIDSAWNVLGMRDVRITRVRNELGRRANERCAVALAQIGPQRAAAIVNLGGRTILVDGVTGEVTESASESSTMSYNLAVDEPRRRFAAAPLSGPIEVHALPDASAVDPKVDGAAIFRQMPGMERLVGKDVTWTGEGSLIAGCAGGRLIAWNAGLDRVAAIESLDRTVEVVRLSPAGPARLAITVGQTVRVYPISAAGIPLITEGKTIFTLPTESGTVVKLEWSPDGRWLAYGTDDGRIATIDATTGEPLGAFPRLAREVVGIAWSVDGRTLVTADAECVRFLDAATTMVFDEVRPEWIIEDMSFLDHGDSSGPILAIAGAAAVSGDVRGELHVGIFNLRRSLSAERTHP